MFDLDLDAAYPKIVPGSWIASPVPATRRCSRFRFVTQIARADFGLSAKVTSLQADACSANLANFTDLRTTTVLAQSEELAIADVRCPIRSTAARLRSIVASLASCRASCSP